MSQPSKTTLADLRVEIDRIDAEMHELLIERGRVIDQLIEIKTRQGGGSAFRPAREASMMRAIAERHRGLLPLDTVESIWRVIISTFTYVQAPYSVHVDVSGGVARMRDSARFHFGFTVPCVQHFGAAHVIDGCRADRGAISACLRSMAARARAPGGRSSRRRRRRRSLLGCRSWSAPITPRAFPCSSFRSPLVDGAAREVVLELVTLDRWRAEIPGALGEIGAEVIGSAAGGTGLALLIARPGDMAADLVSKALRSAGGADVRASEVGAHADRFDATALRKRAN